MSENELAQTLRRTVAEFFEVDVEQVGSDFSLSSGRGQGSIARASLDAMIRRRLGVRSLAVYSANTFRELESAITGGGEGGAATSAPSPPPSPAANGHRSLITPPVPGSSGSAACGVDVEFVKNLPETDDYWEHPFYQANFSPREIAECLHQPSPRQHFAARWCAKEALKKCMPSLLREPMNMIEYVLQGEGPPSLARLVPDREPARLPVAVSLSHSGGLAAAVVVSVPTPSPLISLSMTGEPAVPAAPPTSNPGRADTLATWVALGALALAGWALIRTFVP